MSSLQNMDQVAGNDWSNPSHPMMHELIATDFTGDVDFSSANSMFDDLELQMRASEAEFSDKIKILRGEYVFNNVEAVEYFVRSHRMVAPLLIEAAPRLAATFGSRTALALEVLPDEETPYSIYALALWDGDGAEARNALHVFDEDWLGRNLQAINGRIVFDYELI
jgi:hypothetical protein